MKHLTSGQRAWLRTELEQRQKALNSRLKDHHGGLSRAEHAREVLQQDGDDAPQRESDREVDMALSDLETRELNLVASALQRMQEPEDSYGLCQSCDADIPFDRLKAEPWALRCVVCQGQLERGSNRN